MPPVKRMLFALTLLILFLGGPVSAAQQTLQGDACTIDAEEVIDGNLFALCRTLLIDGTVNGNLIGAATRVEINGTVQGDLYMLVGQIDVIGTIGQDFHALGAVVRLHDTAVLSSESSDVLTGSLSTTLFEGVRVPGSVISVGYQLVLDGLVNGEVNFLGSGLEINGTVNGAVDATVGNTQSTGISQLQTLLIPFPLDIELIEPGLRIGPTALLNNQLTYSSPSAGIIEGEVSLEPRFTEIDPQADFTQINLGEEEAFGRQFSVLLGQIVREFLTLALIGSAALFLIPQFFQNAIRNLQLRPLPSLGVGLLTFILSFPVIVIVIVLSILVITIFSLIQINSLIIASGIMLAMLDVGSAGLFYFIAIFITRVVVSIAVGRWLVRMVIGDDGSQRVLFISLFVGVALLSVLASLPVVGLIFNALTAFLGLGAILITLQGQFRRPLEVPYRSYPTAPSHLPAHPQDARQFPPPIIEEVPHPLGMDNLPTGFKGFDE